LTGKARALECSHVFEINEAFHRQSELDAQARHVAAPGSQRARGGWEVERLETEPFFKPTVAPGGGFLFAQTSRRTRRATHMKTATNNDAKSPAPLWLVIAAFAAIYVIWGSTYLGIRYAVESIPPFLMAGSRNLIAGLLLFGFAVARREGRATRGQWRDAAIAGTLMLAIGNGLVTWAEQTIPSGVTALLVALTPAWMVLFDWLRPTGTRPGTLVIAGLVVGLMGVGLLARQNGHGAGSAYGWGVAALMASSIGWAWGSIFNRSANKPASPFLSVAMQMMCGGALLLIVATAAGELKEFSFSQITWLSFGAWLYLMVAGSIIAFTAYVWLLHVSTPARVSTSAYVNPLIAVLLGSTIGGEPFSMGVLFAALMIIAAVVLVLRGGAKPAPARAVDACEEPA
jgi:drug/metabolite transporter (DMT)-like permease